jgi:adenine deaminase
MPDFVIEGQLVDLHQRRIYPARLEVHAGAISRITELVSAPEHFLLPGFVDAHVHIESSMLTPAQFARLAVVHGTVATVSDPHEIANVCGADGVQWMIDNAKTVPLKVFFGAPSCVPATGFETAGAVLNAEAVDRLLANPDIWYLAEMMNYPGVLHKDPEVTAKLDAARRHSKPIDGHAPGLMGKDAHEYASAGITTDHECTKLEEALEKIAAGMQILIREGSAARNFEALHPLLATDSERVMFCSDDKHPDDLLEGHINTLVQRALAKGYDRFDVLRAACLNPVLHYGIPVGLLREGDPADFIIVSDLEPWQVQATYIAGELVAKEGQPLFEATLHSTINHFNAAPIPSKLLALSCRGNDAIVSIIVADEGQIVTGRAEECLSVAEGTVQSDPGQDILKLVVVNRYQKDSQPAIAFIRGFGLKKGAIASTVAHDCHNLIAVGVDDASITSAINALIEAKGGIAVTTSPEQTIVLPLPIAGLMSDRDGHDVARAYSELNQLTKELGGTLSAPFMTLSFMALLVIPSLKLSDKGLFDGTAFQFTPVLKPN